MPLALGPLAAERHAVGGTRKHREARVEGKGHSHVWLNVLGMAVELSSLDHVDILLIRWMMQLSRRVWWRLGRSSSSSLWVNDRGVRPVVGTAKPSRSFPSPVPRFPDFRFILTSPACNRRSKKSCLRSRTYLDTSPAHSSLSRRQRTRNSKKAPVLCLELWRTGRFDSRELRAGQKGRPTWNRDWLPNRGGKI